jgi:uncharacterized protein
MNGRLRKQPSDYLVASTSSANNVNASSSSSHLLNPGRSATVGLSPIASRMLERDADAMEKYMQRNRSGSSSTDNRSQNGSAYSSTGPSAYGDDLGVLNHKSGATTPRRLRPSASAAQLRTIPDSDSPPNLRFLAKAQSEQRHRAGTTPTQTTRPFGLTRSSSNSTSPLSLEEFTEEPNQSYAGPSSQYAQFPEPPEYDDTGSGTPTNTTANRRKGFHILSKPLPGLEQHLNPNHRRGTSATSVR